MDFQSLEKIRAKIVKRRLRFVIIGLVLLVLTIIAAVLIISNKRDTIYTEETKFFEAFPPIVIISFLEIVILAVILGLVEHKDLKNYTTSYKNYFVHKSLQNVFSNLFYDHTGGFSKAALGSLGVIDTGNRYSSNDYVSGTYKDVHFSQADVHISQITADGDGQQHEETLFFGRWLTFEFKKKLNFRLQITGKKFGSASRTPQGKFEKIEVESIDFNKKFYIRGEDGFEAFYALDPAFIERVQTLGDHYKNRIMLCFIDGKLHIAINDYTDSFETPSVFKKINEEAEFKKVQDDLTVITSLVDNLKLHY